MVLCYLTCVKCFMLPSVHWCCWLGGRKGIRSVKNWVVGCWRGYLSGARCKLAYGPADTTATQCGFTFLVPAHMGSPGKMAIKRLCVCVSLPGHLIVLVTRSAQYAVSITKWLSIPPSVPLIDSCRDVGGIKCCPTVSRSNILVC